MEEWKEYKASMFCASVTDGTHDSPKPQNRGHYLITSKHLKDNDIDFSSANLISDEDYNKVIQRSAVEKYDILYSMIGTIGNVVQVKFDSIDFAVKNMGIFKMGKDALRSTWLYYWLKSPSSREYVYQRLAGSTQSYLTLNSLREFPVLYPGDITAKEIVSILKSLDDKIEVNRKTNENLEQQAQALFKSWFVDFEPFKNQPFVDSELGMIPQDWRVNKLGNVCKCILGGTPSRDKEEYWNGDIAWINSGEVNKFRITTPSEYITEEGLKNSATKLLPRKTTVLAITGATLGQVSLLEIESCANQSVIGVLENSDYPYVFIYPLIKERIGELMSHMTGGAQQHINKKNVEGLDIVIPSPSVMDSFRNITYPIYERIGYLCEENDRLASLRDTLLPKLMSGELDVNEIENYL